MSRVDLSFPVLGQQPLPVDHGYSLYGALSRVLPAIHAENGIAVHPIRGRQIGDRQLTLMPWSSLTLRTEDDRIGELISLSGKQLNVAGRAVRVGVPRVHGLVPAPTLRSRLVTIKGYIEPDTFLEAVQRQLDALEISQEPMPTVGKRRTLRIKDKEVVGYELVIEGLSAHESLALQEQGLGGRRHMGCGLFVPVKTSGGA